MTGCAAAGGEQGDVERLYVEAIGGDPPMLNPQFTSNPITQRVAHSMLEPLVGITGDLELFPVLAEEWEFSDDNQQVTFSLREGVTWHDGEPFTAEDVKFNFEEILPFDVVGAALAERVVAVETPDDHTVVVDLDGEYGPLLETLATQFMLPKHVYEGTDFLTNPANLAPVGTGPLVFDSFTSGEEVVVVKNENWWKGPTEVDRAVFKVIGDTNARALALFSGELDLSTVPPSQQDEVEANPDTEQLVDGYFPVWMYVSMNTRSGPLADPAVRGLVYSAIDRERITEIALKGMGTPATSFIPPAMDWAVHPDIDFDELFPLDIDAINEGLDEAGYPVQGDGTRFTLDVRAITGIVDIDPAIEIMRSTMETVGIRLNVVTGVNAVYTESVFTQHDFDLSIQRSTLGADPSLGITHWFTCNPDSVAGRNPTGMCDEQIDAAAEAALTAADRDVRAQHLYDLQERAAELIFHAPIAWSLATHQTINTSRWQGMDNPDRAAGTIDWGGMTWVG
ncbi:ABC transporter substrate-binding protein [Microbacterium album]|uniref:ABC transporter substrate-binding protein n=1 Tax=Microbacterium album TaxID=2053191 RepID=A0A917ID36_9MICO|nr:ABC transporter substrate-binding protein [Microbacterium album]